MLYSKPALTYEQQVELLKSRGLSFDNEADARHWLTRIGYYRLSAYLIPFKVCGKDQFLPDATFRKALDLYQFDSRLRLLIMQAIDHVEVSVRASLTYKLGHELGPFGYTNPSFFSPFIASAGKGIPAQGFDHGDFMAKLEREITASKEEFVAHYRFKYTSEKHLPIWMATELLTLGTVSKITGEVPKRFKKRMGRDYEISASQFVSWIRCLAYVRNICAHHGRLWNRKLSLKPELLTEWNIPSLDAGRMYVVCLVLRHFLQYIAPSFQWKEGVLVLMSQYPGVDRQEMGFPNGWEQQVIWKETVVAPTESSDTAQTVK
jgi:abortive infection bacteriophage resistance protein